MESTAHPTKVQYYASKMEEAFLFMEAIKAYPVQDCGENLISMKEVVQEEKLEVHFSTTKINETLERIFYLRSGLIKNFVAVCREMNQRGWILKVEDAFRTIQMQKELGLNPKIFTTIFQHTLLELNGKTPDPDFLARRISSMVAGCPKVGTHTSGSAMDISVLYRDSGQEVDRGAPYLELSGLTPMDSPYVPEQARQNRFEITQLMAKHGFTTYPWEFWHYNQGDAYSEYLLKTGKTARYGAIHWDVSSATVTPIANPTSPLNSESDFRTAIMQTLARI